jgi:chorismate synthase
VDRARWDWAEVERNALFCPTRSPPRAGRSGCSPPQGRLLARRVVEVVAEGAPPGLGAPIYGKLDAEIAAALMGINAVKGVEIGDGFAAAALSGEDNADEMRMGRTGACCSGPTGPAACSAASPPGQPIVARFAVKPTSSILTSRRSVDRHGRDVEVETRGRTTPASASAPSRWARRCWRWCWPTICCGTGRRTPTLRRSEAAA